MATYSYYIFHASLRYRSMSSGHGFILTQINHDLVRLPEISGKKPESFISNIIHRVEVGTSPSVLDVDITIVTEDDKTVFKKIREQMSVLNKILIVESPYMTKIGYSLYFDSGFSINVFEKFDFDEIIAGKIHKKIEAALRKVAI